MFYVLKLVLVADSLIRHAESVAIDPGIEVSSVFDLQVVADLVLDVIPVLLFDLIEDFLVVAPINSLILNFNFFRHFFEVTKAVSVIVLFEWDALAELLEDLVPSRQLDVAIHIESHRWLEAWRWYDLDTTILFSISVCIQILNIVDRALELLFCGVKHGHSFDIVEVAVDILGLRERIADGLVQKLLLLPLYGV